MADVNGFDPVPWSVDGGRHRGELYRVEAYASSPGEGVASGLDCRVHALGAPGTQVVIDAGAVRFRNRSAGARNQIYVANGREESRLDVTPTGANGRSDLVIVRAEDPQYPGWYQPTPAEAPDWQYAVPTIVEGVAASTKHWKERVLVEGTPYSAYALARIDIPLNTSVITDDMIVDLRNVANPRSERFTSRRDHPAVNTDIVADPMAPLPVEEDVPIPEWATWAFVRITMSQAMVVTGATQGLFDARLGVGTLGETRIVNGNMYYKEGGASVTRKDYFVAGEMPVHSSLRGTVQPLQMLASRIAGSGGAIRLDNFTQFTFEMDFRERAA